MMFHVKFRKGFLNYHLFGGGIKLDMIYGNF